MDGMLSQEEINALLSSMSSLSEDKSASTESDSLTDAERDAIGEVSNISMGTAATTLSSLVNQKVVITTPVVSYATWDDLAENNNNRPCVFIQIYYKEGLDGTNILILKENDVKIITDLMMGGDGSNTGGELTELHLSAISEAMNQMMGSSSTSISSMIEKRVDISPPNASLIDLNGTIDRPELAPFLKGSFVKVSFTMKIGDLVDSELMQLYPFEFARGLYKMFVKDTQATKETVNLSTPIDNKQTQDQASKTSTNMGQAQQAQPYMQSGQDMSMQGMPMQGMPMQGMPMQGMPMQGMPMQGYPNMQGMPYMQGMQNMPAGSYMVPPMQDVNIQPAQFQSFSANQNPLVQPENINLIMDVPLEVTVELGRTSKSIKEILDFTPGTIIELNKLAGEPIDVLVNGKYVAKGEVVVIEDSFGIRVTEIIK